MAGAKNTDNLHIGGAYCLIDDLQESQINNLSLRGDITKQEHRTSEELMNRIDFVLPVEEGYSASFNFAEFSPMVMNTVMGKPGFSQVPVDQSLANIFAAPFQFTHDPRLKTQKVQMLDTFGGVPKFQYLFHAMSNIDASAATPFRGITAQNVSSSSSTGYVGIYATISTSSSTHESILSPVAIVPHNTGASGNGDRIVVRVKLESDHTAGMRIKIYKTTYTKIAATNEYIGAYATDMGYTSPGTGSPDNDAFGWAAGAIAYYTILSGDVTAGYAQFSVYAKKAATSSSGRPPLPISSVTSADGLTSYVWLTDYNFIPQYKTGSGIKRVSTGNIPAYSQAIVNFYWDAGQVAQMPLGSQLARNPIVPIEFKIPFPNNVGWMLCHLHRGQIRTNWSLNISEGNWTEVPFDVTALDASDEFPYTPFGYWQMGGPIAQQITNLGNFGALMLGESALDALISMWA